MKQRLAARLGARIWFADWLWIPSPQNPPHSFRLRWNWLHRLFNRCEHMESSWYWR